MAITDMQCPNCGAPVDFAGGKRATCSFCRSQLSLTGDGVKASSLLNDLLDNQPVSRGVDIERVQQLVREGKKIEAIKLVREQTDLGLKEAKDAVDSIERGETPELKPRTASTRQGVSGVDLDEINELLLQNKKIEAIRLYREQTGVGLSEAKDAIAAIEKIGSPVQEVSRIPVQPALKSTSRLGCIVGCLPTVFFMGLCAGFIMLSSQIMFRAFGPLDQALQIINSDPKVVQAFGQPINPGAFIVGEINSGGSSSSAGLSTSIYGPKRSGELSVDGEWRRGVWNLSIWVTYDQDGEEQTIFITQKVK